MAAKAGEVWLMEGLALAKLQHLDQSALWAGCQNAQDFIVDFDRSRNDK
jgi:hypothetical protein